MSALAEQNYLYRRPDLYDELAAGDRSKAEQVTKLVAAHGISTVVSVCDLGCGAGRDLGQLDWAARRVGIDIQEGMISYGRRLRPELDLRVGDPTTVRLDERFDVLICLGNSYAYLHHDQEQLAAWGTFTAHAKSGTLLIIQTLLEPVEPATVRRGHTSTPMLETDTSWEIDWEAIVAFRPCAARGTSTSRKPTSSNAASARQRKQQCSPSGTAGLFRKRPCLPGTSSLCFGDNAPELVYDVVDRTGVAITGLWVGGSRRRCDACRAQIHRDEGTDTANSVAASESGPGR